MTIRKCSLDLSKESYNHMKEGCTITCWYFWSLSLNWGSASTEKTGGSQWWEHGQVLECRVYKMGRFCPGLTARKCLPLILVPKEHIWRPRALNCPSYESHLHDFLSSVESLAFGRLCWFLFRKYTHFHFSVGNRSLRCRVRGLSQVFWWAGYWSLYRTVCTCVHSVLTLYYS